MLHAIVTGPRHAARSSKAEPVRLTLFSLRAYTRRVNFVWPGRAAFEALLCSLFSEDGLRRWIRNGPEGDEVCLLIPNPAKNMRDLVHQTTEVLIRRGLIETRLFEGLSREFPQRRTDIQRELRALLDSRPAGVKCPLPTQDDVAMAAASIDLDRAFECREDLLASGHSTAKVDADILRLRRILREGPLLKSGVSLDRRYKLLNVIGTGGYALVWRAYDRELRTLVAVKVLHGQWLADHSIRERFTRGARSMARMQHANVVRVLRGVFEDDGYLAYVMELIPGGDLRQRALAMSLPEPDVLNIFAQLCDGLHHAHTLGFVHRDIKPSNILLDDKGSPRLTDFDMAKANDTTGGTRTGAGMGTFFYTAPEALNNAAHADARADIYSLGMTLLFCLSRREPDLDVLLQPEASIAALSYSPQLKDVCKRAITRARDARPESALQLQEAIRDIQHAAHIPLATRIDPTAPAPQPPTNTGTSPLPEATHAAPPPVAPKGARPAQPPLTTGSPVQPILKRDNRIRICPYRPGSSTSRQALREGLIGKIYNTFARFQHRACTLHGQRRIGKTTLLHQLHKELPLRGNFKTVYFDLQDTIGQPLAEVYQRLATAILLALDLPTSLLNPTMTEHIFHHELISRMHHALGDNRLILLLDELDAIKRYAENTNDPFSSSTPDDTSFESNAHSLFSCFNRLLTDHPWMNFVFVSDRPAEDLALTGSDIIRRLFRNQICIAVSTLTSEETYQIIDLSEHDGSLSWSEAAKWRVWTLTNGHPLLAQALCCEVWEAQVLKSSNPPASVSAAQVDAAVDPVLEQWSHPLEWLWDGFSPACKVIASSLAQHPSAAIPPYVIEQTIINSDSQHMVKLMDAVHILKQWDLLVETDNCVSFRVELIRRWIYRYKPFQEIRKLLKLL